MYLNPRFSNAIFGVTNAFGSKILLIVMTYHENLLKGLRHPANSGSKQIIVKLEILFLKFFVLSLGCGYKYIQQIQKDIPLKKFLETLSLFYQPEFPEKGRDFQKLDRLCDVTTRVNTI